ncbi:MAG TPA: CheR family methyltransferase [Thermoanaerobaculia bacterium]|jgi:PAS domain S-box-containing protein
MTDTNDPGNPAPAAAESARKNFLVVGLGGSAGAITSFREFFRNVPADSGMAYVVILHLSPEHESRLAEVLQSVAKVPVVQVQAPMRVEPDHVYVIPPNKSLALNDGHLVLSDVTSFEERRAPVDIFFRTLADNHDSRAVCVVMSGSGSDGSMGLQRVKEYNGLVLVQDPAEASFGEMPRSCIATGLVDFVIPAAEMPRRIAEYREQLRTVHIAADSDASADDDEQALVDVFTLLRQRTGQDFSNYKRATVLRRIERRMAVRDIQRLPLYAAFLRDHNDEAHALLRELLISVTNFFRDREVWEKVERELIPRLIAPKRADEHLRVWVPGCATGEEAYSIAMLLAERAVPGVQIFATDLDERAIARARNGWYSSADAADVSPERLRRFFLKEQDGYRVGWEIREMVLFAHHNLLKDPPFSHLDLVSCRNLMIYLDRAAQQRAMETLHFALAPGGFLLLGTAESVDGSANLFSVEDKEAHVYRARAVDRVINVRPPLPHAAVADARPVLESVRPTEARPRERLAPLDLHHRLLEQYAPPSLVVDDQYDIVHLTERAGRYLQFSGGEASTNLLHVIRQELRTDVRAALFQAAQKRTAVAAHALEVHLSNEVSERIDLVVRPVLSDDDPARGFFLILFEPSRTPQEPVHESAAVEPAARHLDEELLRIKAQMRGTIELYEVQVEEAKAANEELQAMNEELRSTAEELETSQEELQSVNEELQTVNQELKVKIEEVTHAGDDLRNLISSTDIGTIFIDRALRVKLFTPRARDIFNLIPGDVGRPLLDITHKLTLDDLAAGIDRVIERLQPVEREVATRDGAWYLMRLVPYRTSEDRIDGVVLTFLEITERHRAEIALRESEARYRTLFESIDQGFCTIEVLFDGAEAVDYQFLEVNPAFEQQTGLSNVVGRRMRDVAPEHEHYSLETYGRVALTGEPARFESESTQPGRWLEVNAYRVGEPQLRRVGILFEDITDRRRAEEQLRKLSEADAFRLRLVNELAPLEDPEQIQQTAARLIAEHLRVERAVYFEVERDDVALRAEYVRGVAPLPERMRFSDFGGFRDVHKRGETLLIDDVAADERLASHERRVYHAAGVSAVASAQLVKGGHQWVASFALHSVAPRAWTDIEVRLLRETAERTWDATESARAVAALRESEERLHAIANLVPDLLWMTAATGETVWYNERWLAYTGQTLDAIPPPEWTDPIHSDERAEAAESYRRAVAEGRAMQHEYRIRGASGDYRWFLVNAVPFRDDAGRVVRYYAAATDVHEQRIAREELEARVQERTQALLELSVNRQQLLERLVNVTEEERQRIARELHDEMGQHITALRVRLESFRNVGVDDLKAIITRIDQSIDRMTLELRPPALDQLGLHGAISTLGDEFSGASGIRVALHLGVDADDRFAEDIESALYRVLQESLTNVWKHAAASTVSIILERDRSALRMIIEDDGRGFDAVGTAGGPPARGRFGLLGMRERLALVGGTFDIESEAERGATIFVQVPLTARERGA